MIAVERTDENRQEGGSVPVIVVGYNRAEVLKRTLENLSRCVGYPSRRVYIYLDGIRIGRDGDVGFVNETRMMVKEFCKNFTNVEVRQCATNLGCRKNIVQAVREVLQKHGRMILIEDDVLVSRTFLQYMDDALDFYADDKRIWSVNAYQCRYLKIPPSYPYDVYLNRRNWTPGWGTWRDRWESVDFDLSDWHSYKKNPENIKKVDDVGFEVRGMIEMQANAPEQLNAWDVQCTYHMIKNGLYSVEPRFSLTKNVGFGVRSEHCSGIDPTMPTQKYYNFRPKLVSGILPDSRIMKQFRYASMDPRLLHRIVRKAKRILWGWGPRHDEPIDVE